MSEYTYTVSTWLHDIVNLASCLDFLLCVQQMRRSGNDEDNKRIIMDLDVVVKSHNCPYIIQCIGTFIFTVIIAL